MTAKRAILTSLFVLAAAAYLSKENWLPEHTTLSIPPPKAKAFLSADWGMTPQEVTSANGAALNEKGPGRLFYQAEPGEESRYKALEAPCRFLARDSVVSYTFRDGRLVSYHVFTSDADSGALDADMRRYLKRMFGQNADEISDGSALKLVWQTKDRIVNYWSYEEQNALSRPYRAGFGVQNRST